MKKLIILLEVFIIIAILYLTWISTSSGAEGEYFILRVTAYCPCEICCGKWANGLTYTGDVAGYGCVAIDPNAGILKLGQRVYVEGYGYGVCNDIGGAIRGWEADVCFPYHWQALKWAVRLVKVYVLEVK